MNAAKAQRDLFGPQLPFVRDEPAAAQLPESGLSLIRAINSMFKSSDCGTKVYWLDLR